MLLSAFGILGFGNAAFGSGLLVILFIVESRLIGLLFLRCRHYQIKGIILYFTFFLYSE